jgi:hypothetical protein
VAITRADAAERILERVVVEDNGCWIWQGDKLRGYGIIHIEGRIAYCHRVMYEELVGPIPDGLVLDHLCRVLACCRPAHCEPVTQRENTLRGVGPTAVNAHKTHCARGHEFTPENTQINRAGARRCRQCRREDRARYRATDGALWAPKV